VGITVPAQSVAETAAAPVVENPAPPAEKVPAKAAAEEPAPAVVPEPVSKPVAPFPGDDPSVGAVHYHDDYDLDHDEDDEEHGEGLIGHKDHPHEDLIDMTPMVDIVFFLLIFFLTTSMTALQAVMNLPKVRHRHFARKRYADGHHPGRRHVLDRR
jgi:hypothetical protein